MVLTYITCKDSAEAERIAMHLLKKRLIACANIFPVRSIYWWNKRITKDNEVVLFAKTNEKNFNKVSSEVKRLHSYDIPCIMRIDVQSNKEYEEWADNEMR